MMNDYILSLIRTWTPIAVGAVLSWLAARGLSLDEQATYGLTAFLTGLGGAVYYALVRALETRWPALGRLLGAKRAPVYEAPVPDAVRAVREGRSGVL
jgi:hypothetical protein